MGQQMHFLALLPSFLQLVLQQSPTVGLEGGAGVSPAPCHVPASALYTETPHFADVMSVNMCKPFSIN